MNVAWRSVRWPGGTRKPVSSAPFYSQACGAAHRLKNGNTLIVESDGGRAFEVTPDKLIVWEFYSPHRAGRDGELTACLYDLQRFPATFDWLD